MADLSFAANLVSGLTSAAQGYMTGQQFMLKQQNDELDHQAKQYELLLKNKQLDIENAKLAMEQRKIDHDALKGEKDISEKQINVGVLKQMKQNGTLTDPALGAMLNDAEARGLTDADKVTYAGFGADSVKFNAEANAAAIKAQQERENTATKETAGLSVKANENNAKVLDDFTKNPSVVNANTILGMYHKSSNEGYDPKTGKKKSYEQRLAEDPAGFYGTVQLQGRTLAKLSDPSTGVKNAEELSMQLKGLGLEDKIKGWVSGELKAMPTKKEAETLDKLTAQYVLGARETIEEAARAHAVIANKNNQGLSQIGDRYSKDGGKVSTNKVGADYFLNASPDYAVTKNYVLPKMGDNSAPPAREIYSTGGKITGKPEIKAKPAMLPTDEVQIELNGKVGTTTRAKYEAALKAGRPVKLVLPSKKVSK